MPEKKCDLLITSVDPCAELTILSQKLGKALRTSPQKIEFSLNEIASLGGSDFRILRGVNEIKAKQLQAYLSKQGLGSELRAEISLEAMTEEAPKYICPACDHRQEPDPKGNDACESCGVIGKKYADIKKRKDILESERRRHQALQDMGLEQSRSMQAAEEEKRLREEARKKLGIKKEKSPILLAGLIILIGVGSVTAYIYQDKLLESDDSVVAEQLASSSAKPQDPMLTVPATGGNITLNMPESGSANTAGQSTQTAQAVAQSTVVTTENAPPLTDDSSQNLALEINQLSSDVEQAAEAKVKASLVAHSIDSPSSRKAVLQITGGEEAVVDQAMVNHLTLVEQEDSVIEDPHFSQLMMLAGDQVSQGNYSQAIELTSKTDDKYQQAVLLHKIIKSEISESLPQKQIDEHIAQLAKLIWNENESTKQVRIQGLLSTAYDLAGEKKVASLNLVMAIEKLRFVGANEIKIDLLCELSKGQRMIGNVSQAREILKFAEDKANKLELVSQSEFYAKIVKSYAKAMDFSSAMELTEKINDPALLRETLGTITEIQDEYMSASSMPV